MTASSQPATEFTRRRRSAKASRPTVGFDEIGTTGLRQYGGFVVEEWMARLVGRRGAWVYREMADNDPVIGAFLFAIGMLARGVPWSIEEGADTRSNEFVESCMDDMSGTWPDFVAEAFSMLPYGWSFHEIVYKRRQGVENAVPSKYDDGLVGWRKLPVRAQETLMNWEFADDGGIQAMVQIAYDGVKRVIPMEKAVLFRTDTRRNNPEGRSTLRNAVRPWFYKKEAEQIEAIGLERDLAGIPVLETPEDFIWNENDPDTKKLIDAARDLVTSIRRDEDEGVVLPPRWRLSLLSSGGSRQIDTDAIIRRYDQRIATTVLADFILLAQDKVGSYALADIKVDTFGQAMQVWLGVIAEVMNRYAIPRLLRINGMPLTDPPRIVPGQVGQRDLDKVGAFLQSLSLAGAPIVWGPELMGYLFDLGGLPEPERPEDAIELDRPEPEPGAERPPLPRPGAADDQPENGPEADDMPGQDVRKAAGRPVPVARTLARRARVLAYAFQGEIGRQFADLGQQAERSYLLAEGIRKAADTPSGTPPETIAGQILASLNLPAWVRNRLGPLYTRHYQRVLKDTLRTLRAEIGLHTDLPDPVAREILARGGTQLGLLDVEGPARDAIIRAIAEGRANGEGPLVIARRIRDAVPAGRFTQAGSSYRAQLIARTETMNAQRLSSLAAYRDAPNVTAVALRDGLLSTSDDDCIGRDGDIVSFDDAEQLCAEEHPLGTLSFDPVVG